MLSLHASLFPMLHHLKNKILLITTDTSKQDIFKVKKVAGKIFLLLAIVVDFVLFAAG